MAIQVHLCENDEYGNPLGRAVRMDFDPIVCSLEETVYPPSGVRVRWLNVHKGEAPLTVGRIRIGREEFDVLAKQTLTGNVFWNTVWIAGVDAVRLINYMMKLKHWDCTEAEEYIFQQWDKREPLDPSRMFSARQPVASA